MPIKKIIIRISIIILIIEAIIMQSLNLLDLGFSSIEETIVDALSLAIFSAPFIYIWVIKPFILMKDSALEEISHLAYYDNLTDLPNKNKLLDLLEHSINISQDDDNISVIFIELDRIKRINYSLGHSAVDEIIKKVSDKIKKITHNSWLLSRVGQNRFAILVNHVESDDIVYAIANNVLNTIREPIQLKEHSISLDAHIGISSYPKDSKDKDDLLKFAQTAMGHAKTDDEDSISFYTKSLTETVHKHFLLEEDLRHALERDQFFLLYQPKIDAQTNKIIGVEALIRWEHPIQGVINPIYFINLAEEIGVIIQIGEWVLKEAIRQQQRWKKEGKEPITMSINLSSKQLRPDHIVHIVQTLGSSEILTDHIEFEITETAMMDNQAQAQILLEMLHQKGVSLALDDFGTGYSSFAYLKRFQVDILKIDRMLIKDIQESENDFTIAKAIVVMAHTLGIKVVAEGVETKEQAEMLKEIGCDYLQGFYYSKPASADSIYSNNNYII